MNKSDLVSRLTARLDGDRRTATAAVNGVLEEIEQSLVRGEKVSLVGFGTFDRRERGPRTARNPATGATIQVGASVAPVFRAGVGLKQQLAEAAGTARAAAATVTAPVDKAANKAANKAGKKAAKGAKAASKPSSKATAKVASTSKSTKAAAGKAAKKASGKTPKKG